jgi:hypothetical protein
MDSAFDVIGFLGLQAFVKKDKGKVEKELESSLIDYLIIRFIATFDDKTLLQLKSTKEIVTYIKNLPNWQQRAREYAGDFKTKLKEKLV